MQNITKNLRKTNITVSLHEKDNIYQAVINYKDDNNKRKQKWVSTGIKVVRGNKRIAMQKAEELREKFEKSFNLQNRIKQENDEQAKNAIIEGMEAAADYIKSLPQKFYDWGKDMVQNLIDGIQAKIDALRAKISELAGMVASYIHFSEPDVGPLSDFHTYMPDMIDELVNGINQGIPQVAQAMNGLAQNMVPQANAQGMANNSTNTFNINVYGAQGQNVSELADVIEQRITENVMRRGVAFG